MTDIEGFLTIYRHSDKLLNNDNLLLTEREGLGNIGPRSWQYGPSAARSIQKRARANITQYGPEQVKLVSSLLYGIILRKKQHFR